MEDHDISLADKYSIDDGDVGLIENLFDECCLELMRLEELSTSDTLEKAEVLDRISVLYSTLSQFKYILLGTETLLSVRKAMLLR